MMKKTVKILRALLTLLLFIVLTVNLWLIGARLVLHQDLPKILGYSKAVVISGSMEPTFSAGDMLIFRQQNSYKTGDVVIFRQENILVTHRIIEETQDGFITQGDANNTRDIDPVKPNNIEGKLKIIIPKIGGMLTFLHTPLGILLIIISGIALVELSSRMGDRGKVGEK